MARSDFVGGVGLMANDDLLCGNGTGTAGSRTILVVGLLVSRKLSRHFKIAIRNRAKQTPFEIMNSRSLRTCGVV